MNREEALNKCMLGNKAVTNNAVPEGKCIKFIAGSFKLCNLDGSNPSAIGNLLDTTGTWEVVNATTPTDLAVHMSKTTGEVFFSAKGGSKCANRDANDKLIYIQDLPAVTLNVPVGIL